MHRTLVTRSLGFTLAALVALSMGTRPPIQASQAPAVVAASAVAGGFDGNEDEPLSSGPIVHLAAKPMSPEATRVWLKLQEKVAMQFPNDTPLKDVLEYVAASTKDKGDFPEGLSFYVDPLGLQEADKTMASTVTINLKGIPLATTLRLLLKQLGLVSRIEKDGFVFITSESSDDSSPDPEHLILDNLSALRAEVKALRAEVRLFRGHGGSIMGGGMGGTPDSKPAGGMGGGMRSTGGMM